MELHIDTNFLTNANKSGGQIDEMITNKINEMNTFVIKHGNSDKEYFMIKINLPKELYYFRLQE